MATTCMSPTSPVTSRPVDPEEHHRLVTSIAAEVVKKYGLAFCYDDLVAFGITALQEAADTFDPDKGFRFSTWAYPKIRGRLIDGARAMGWLSRRRPEIEEKGRQALAGYSTIQQHHDLRWPGNPEAIVIQKQLWDLILDAIDQLSHKERQVIVQSVFNGVSLRSFATQHQRSAAWACRLKQRSLERIRELVEKGDAANDDQEV